MPQAPKLIALSKVIDGHKISCTDRCHEAKGSICHCVCGGRYHGVATREGEYKKMCDELGIQVPESSTPD